MTFWFLTFRDDRGLILFVQNMLQQQQQYQHYQPAPHTFPESSGRVRDYIPHKVKPVRVVR